MSGSPVSLASKLMESHILAVLELAESPKGLGSPLGHGEEGSRSMVDLCNGRSQPFIASMIANLSVLTSGSPLQLRSKACKRGRSYGMKAKPQSSTIGDLFA